MPVQEQDPAMYQQTTAAIAPKPYSIAVLMTSFNRRESTLRCLEAVRRQAHRLSYSLEIFLVDDLSRDGTVEAVREAFPEVHLFLGTGDLFWNRGMHRAFGEAMRAGFDYYLWLNDDTLLFPHALDALLEASLVLQATGALSIVTGSTCDNAGKRSYGGIAFQGRWIRSIEAVQPSLDRVVACDTMNGNCTLIPAAIAVALHNLDPAFHHSFGDLDYGFRARRAGFSVHVAPGFVGTCTDNPQANTWRDRSASFKVRWRHLNSAKGSPFPEWSTYCRRHLGPLWPLYAVSPYAKTLFTGFFRR